MAIVGPSQLPKVLKADSNPLKMRVLHHFGYPNVNVELTEDQLEELLRVTGDFICTYFPKQERYAYFYTKPLVTEYDLPKDAWWIREVVWDPVANRIYDVFSAEMFLFCFAPGFKVYNKDGDLVDVEKWNSSTDAAASPYGFQRIEISKHSNPQPLLSIKYKTGEIICTPNQPIKTGSIDVHNMLDGWVTASELSAGSIVATINGPSEVICCCAVDGGPTITVSAPESQCFFGCHSGVPILVH